jgi:hypothetical protein
VKVVDVPVCRLVRLTKLRGVAFCDEHRVSAMVRRRPNLGIIQLDRSTSTT